MYQKSRQLPSLLLAGLLLLTACSGEPGLDGRPLLVDASPASSEQCPEGGTVLGFGYDHDGDGGIDELITSHVICEGAEGPEGEQGPQGEQGPPGEAGRDLLVETTAADAADCPAGGLHILIGYDTTNDGSIDQVSTEEVVCDGADGLPTLMESNPADPGTCPNGGVEYTFGYDTSGDGLIDVVLHVDTVCNGLDASELLVEQATATACPNGGVEFTFGYDTSGDGFINDIATVQSICNGEDGQDGLPLSVEITTEELCNIISFGYDTNNDGSIDEVTETVELCIPLEQLIVGMDVLVYVDNPRSSNQVLAGLNELAFEGLISLRTVTTQQDFRAALTAQVPTIALYFVQAGGSPDSATIAAILDFHDNGGRVVFSTWTSSALIEALGASFSGSINELQMSFASTTLARDLPDPLAVGSFGIWATFTRSYTPGPGATSVCSWESTESCAVIGPSGRSMLFGPLADALPDGSGRAVMRNILAKLR